MKDIMPILSMMLSSYGKFRIDNPRERVALVISGVLLWYLVGLASEVVISKKRRKNKKNKENENNNNKYV